MICSKNYVLTDLIATAADATADPDDTAAPTNTTFKETDTKLYDPVVTLSAENGNRPSDQLKTRF